MDIRVLAAIIGGTAGLIGGTLTSVVAPWVKLSVEKKKDLWAYRREKIKYWRSFIESNYDDHSFANTSVYSELRPHLSKETIDNIEGYTLKVRQGRGGQVIKGLLLDDISKIESEWKLI